MSKRSLRWTKTTPFKVLGRLGEWSIYWVESEKAYVARCDGEARFTHPTVTEAIDHAEHMDIGDSVCTHCNGSGWTR